MKKSTAPQPLSAEFLIQRMKCCGSGCHNCPYVTSKGNRHVAETHTLHIEFVAFIKKHPGKTWSDFTDSLHSSSIDLD